MQTAAEQDPRRHGAEGGEDHALPADPIAGTTPHHLVQLSSLEDDGFGDELTVIWEIEPIESPAEIPAPAEPEHVGPAQS